MDVVCLGEALVDFYPQPAGASLQTAPAFVRYPGGAPANVAIGVARLGGRSALVSRVGQDDFGRYLQASLSAEGVDVSMVGVEPGVQTGLCFVSVSPTLERRFVGYPRGVESADKRLCPEHLDWALIGGARVLYAGSTGLCAEPSRATTLDALARARARGLCVFVDVNLRLHQWPDHDEAIALVRELVSHAHVVKAASDEIAALCGTDDPRQAAARLRSLGPGCAVVTRGAAGALAEGPDGVVEVAGVPVAAVDPTGAGDAFAAAFCLGLAELAGAHAGAIVGPLRGERLGVLLERANRAGALATTAFGATAGLPR